MGVRIKYLASKLSMLSKAHILYSELVRVDHNGKCAFVAGIKMDLMYSSENAIQTITSSVIVPTCFQFLSAHLPTVSFIALLFLCMQINGASQSPTSPTNGACSMAFLGGEPSSST